MLCQVWRNIGYCRWEEIPEIKDIPEDKIKDMHFDEEETSDCIIPMEPIKS